MHFLSEQCHGFTHNIQNLIGDLDSIQSCVLICSLRGFKHLTSSIDFAASILPLNGLYVNHYELSCIQRLWMYSDHTFKWSESSQAMNLFLGL